MAETRPILSLFGVKKRSIKMLIIDHSECLSKDAQAALRRTMEVYSDHFRIIMLCTESSKLIEPIRSRCLLIRMRGYTDDEVNRICTSVLQKEGMTINDGALSEIITNSAGDCKRALCILELYMYNSDSSDHKKVKADLKNFKLDWEKVIDEIAKTIQTAPKVDSMILIRRELYNLLNSGISPTVIMLEMTRRLFKGTIDKMNSIISFALKFEERIRLGNKPIYHLEAFSASVMCVITQK